MKEYRIFFEDLENGLKCPVILDLAGDDFFDAIDRARDEILLADSEPEIKIA